MAYNLDEIDQHMANLRSTLRFFSEALDRTDHNSPDWLATDLVSLRNQSGRLQDGMQRFREQLVSVGLAAQKTPKSRNRLSLEGANRPTPSSTPAPPSPQSRAQPPTPSAPSQAQTLAPEPPSSPLQNEYPVQRIDVTEEVRRRLHESRLRRLMDSPSTSQKRKFDAYEGVESGGDTEGGGGETEQEVWTVRKRARASGAFEPVGRTKRKEEGITVGWEDVGVEERGRAKRVRR
ncbi:hypothetical protein BU23DRAFT_534774 [Bimuria novae-zelandiae CBS 107.79]|uniref:Uncharacterized protein n=1 Tax=Bimuria novae-zelandiae CBS 107.79 TaxID=1447943 RepID=A0A6A5V6K4_9PLEO|nr:hypothetical protein BU23DRAFT_534774 [Bimuria novae-zelandiae CBS 107.79]